MRVSFSSSSFVVLASAASALVFPTVAFLPPYRSLFFFLELHFRVQSTDVRGRANCNSAEATFNYGLPPAFGSFLASLSSNELPPFAALLLGCFSGIAASVNSSPGIAASLGEVSKAIRNRRVPLTGAERSRYRPLKMYQTRTSRWYSSICGRTH